MTIVNKLFKVVTYRKKPPPIHSHYPSIRCSCEVTKRRLIDTKQSEILAYFERLPLLKPHDPLNHVTNVSSNMIFWKIISPLSQGLWAPNLPGCWLTWGGSARLSCHRLLVYIFVVNYQFHQINLSEYALQSWNLAFFVTWIILFKIPFFRSVFVTFK